jgi:energy-coupling factor transporter ATP-binding protein EcfA2/outer membrane lipoprotein SlyB
MREGIVNIQQQINAALAGRAGQRDFVDKLAGNWEALAESFGTLVSAAAALARASAAAAPSDPEYAKVFDSVGGSLAPGSDWRKKAAELADRLDAGTELIGVLRHRVHRETVNVGVIGVTGAGKSTLLRKLSGLTEEHIPSNRFASSTATPSRIFNEPESARERAVLNLHTWPTFRDEVLQPLHEKAGLGPAPALIDEFRQFSYPTTAGDREAGAERYYRKLRQARDSLGSYQTLLRGGAEEVALDRLRPFVAYPPDESSDERPYHAVRSADIYTHFPRVGEVSLGLVDLPGSGEAGLDVHKRFLTDLKNSTDLVFIVKRPNESPSTDQDWDARQLADDASAGVRRSDFAYQVINRDSKLEDEAFEAAERRAQADSAQLGIDVRVCDIGSESDTVIETVLMPVLDHLAERLAFMDRDAVAFVLKDLDGAATAVRSLGRELDHMFSGWQGSLPDEEVQRRDRFRKLKNQVGRELEKVRDEYDRLYESGQPIAELHQQIETAGQEIKAYLASSLGSGSKEKWIDSLQDAIAGKNMGDELDRQYNSSRKFVVKVFGEIDASLDRAIDRLHGAVAASLRRKLTQKIVPEGADNSVVLAGFAASIEPDARMLSQATRRLLDLRADYGSIFLRVGRPVVRKIDWYRDQSQTTAGQAAGVAGRVASGLAAQAAPRVAGHVAGVAAGHLGGPIAGMAAAAAVNKAVSSALHQGGGKPGAGSDWLNDYVTSSPTQPPAAPAPPASTPTPAPASQAVDPGPGGARLSDAAYWYDRLTGTISSVTAELQREFHAEAQRTLKVLAAAVDLYKDSATTPPGMEVEYERVCLQVQQDIWPGEFGEASAKLTADMAALRKLVSNAEAAADGMTALAGQVTRL